MQTCCVIGCKRGINRSVFSIPNNDHRRKEWLKRIPNPPRSKWVCEWHFEKKYILDEKSATKTKQNKSFKRKQLLPNAIPTIFVKPEPKPAEIPKLIYIDPLKVGHQLLDKIGTFTELQQNIGNRLRLQEFQIKIKQSEIFLFDFNESDDKRLTIRTSVVITNDFKVIIHFNGLKQTMTDVCGIFGNDFKFMNYSQLQKLINKYTAIQTKTPKLLEYDNGQIAELSETVVVTVAAPPKPKTDNTTNDLKNLKLKAISCLKELQNYIAQSDLYYIDLNFMIEQISLIKKFSVGQGNFKMETIIQSYLFYCHMGNAYDALRNEFILNLPTLSTMKQLTSLDIQPRLIAHHKMGYIFGGITKMNPCEKLVNIQIKEIYYKGRISVLALNEKNITATSVICFIMNSIFGTMKKIVYLQPICSNISGSATDLYTITMSVIERVQNLKLKVISITAELNLKTKTLFQQLMSTASNDDEFDNKENFRFSNSMHKNEHIYLLYNPANILKNIRNNWIDQNDQRKTLKYPNFDTGAVQNAYFSHLYELYESESDMLIKTAIKLDRESVYPNANDRELFSNTLNVFDMTTISALRTASRGYNETVDLLNLINTWWTIVDIRDKKNAIGSLGDGNLILLESLTEWTKKWKLLSDNNSLDIDTHEALIQTSSVIVQLAKHMIGDRNIVGEFLPGKFHTDDMQNVFSKYKIKRNLPIRAM